MSMKESLLLALLLLCFACTNKQSENAGFTETTSQALAGDVEICKIDKAEAALLQSGNNWIVQFPIKKPKISNK